MKRGMEALKLFWISLLIWNLITFLAMGSDKRKAIRGKRRIPEKTLLWMAFLFGSAGATVGMFFFRHKTLHNRFRFGLPAMLILHIIVLIFGAQIIY